MGFKNLVSKLVETAVRTVGDLAVTVAYTHIESATVYDATTDTQTKRKTNVSFSAVTSQQSDNEFDYAKVQDKHLKIIVSALAIPFIPSSDDTARINGRSYVVMRVKHLPGDSAFVIYMQET